MKARWRLAFIALALVLTTGAVGVAITERSLSTKLFDSLNERSLREVPRGFRIIALSMAAEYAAGHARDPDLRAASIASLNRIVELALSKHASPYGGAPPRELGPHGLYLSHLGIVLAAHRKVTGSRERADLHARIAQHLVRLMREDPHHHAPSYPNQPARWPADQAALLFALFAYDRVEGTSLHRAPLARWLEVMERHRAANGLHLSEVRTGDHPRGCALSWTVRYLHPLAPEAAEDLWRSYREHYAESLGPALGFREWPRGVDRAGDIDSGPIVYGVGVAATALALGASRRVGDHVSHQRLQQTMVLGYQLTPPQVARHGENLLAYAIAAEGVSGSDWW